MFAIKHCHAYSSTIVYPNYFKVKYLCSSMILKFVSVLCIVCAVHCHEAPTIPNSSNHSECLTSTSDSFGYEVLLGKLEDLESKFWNMWLEMKEQNEHIMRNHSRLQDTHQGMLWMLTRLEQAVGHNLTTVMHRSWEILQQQISCANHDRWKQAVLAMLPNEKIAKLAKQLSTTKIFTQCNEVPETVSGKYSIHPQGFQEPFEVYCEQEVFTGGWLVVQYRFDGSVDFYRNWTEYRNGFGSLGGEFWIGLEKLYRLTKYNTYELVVELKDYNGNYVFARYDEFEIGDEDEKYSLKKLGSYSGNAGDSLRYHKSMNFSTMDCDNDRSSNNCAENYMGAWWYNECHFSNLNALYKNGNDATYLSWYHMKDKHMGLAYSRMMIRKK